MVRTTKVALRSKLVLVRKMVVVQQRMVRERRQRTREPLLMSWGCRLSRSMTTQERWQRG